MATRQEQRHESDTHPHKGDTYECRQCGMQVEITSDCDSAMGGPIMQCCGEEMQRAGGSEEHGEHQEHAQQEDGPSAEMKSEQPPGKRAAK